MNTNRRTDGQRLEKNLLQLANLVHIDQYVTRIITLAALVLIHYNHHTRRVTYKPPSYVFLEKK